MLIIIIRKAIFKQPEPSSERSKTNGCSKCLILEEDVYQSVKVPQ